MIIETQLMYRDLMIGVEGANFVLRNLNGLTRYHYTLEYERFLIKINQKDIRLDKHIYIYIHYLLYLLSEEGLEGTQLLTKARAHLTTDGFFVEGRAVLSKNLVYAIEFKKEFYKYLIRIADSYYTKIFRKSKRVMSELIKIFEFVVPECGYISREIQQDEVAVPRNRVYNFLTLQYLLISLGYMKLEDNYFTQIPAFVECLVSCALCYNIFLCDIETNHKKWSDQLKPFITKHMASIVADRAICLDSEEWELAFKDDRINLCFKWPALNSRLGKRLSDINFIETIEDVKFVHKKI